MTRRKLDKYQYSQEAGNVIERGNELYTSIKGKWQEIYFKNQNPLVLELACGKGEYTTGLAQKFPNVNFIGIDIKGDRLARGSKIAWDLGLPNVAFLRSSIKYLDEFFQEDDISAIWLIHPDPHVRERDEKKRLTHPTYLKQYERYLVAGGEFHLKTDSQELYEYSMKVLPESNLEVSVQTRNLYESEALDVHHGISTHYERVFVSRGFSIHYINAVNKKSAPL